MNQAKQPPISVNAGAGGLTLSVGMEEHIVYAFIL